MAVEIAVETPLQDDVRALVAELNATLLELTPPEHCSHMTVEQMADRGHDGVRRARRAAARSACGALKPPGGGIGEVKRMYTRPRIAGSRSAP